MAVELYMLCLMGNAMDSWLASGSSRGQQFLEMVICSGAGYELQFSASLSLELGDIHLQPVLAST